MDNVLANFMLKPLPTHFSYRTLAGKQGGKIKDGQDGGKKKVPMSDAAKRLFQMVDMNGDGLVSFHEYVFCLTVMAIPEAKFK